MTQPATNQLAIQYFPLQTLLTWRWEDNPKLHTSTLIEGSVRKFGFNDPIGVDAHQSFVTEGHGRLEFLERIKRLYDTGHPDGFLPANIGVAPDSDWLIPCVNLVFATREEAILYALVHNRSNASGLREDDYDQKKMRAVVEARAKAGQISLLDGIGFGAVDFRQGGFRAEFTNPFELAEAPAWDDPRAVVAQRQRSLDMAEVESLDTFGANAERELTDNLLPHPRRFRFHPEDQMAELVQSIAQNKIYRPVIITSDNYVLDGHALVEAARRIGIKYVPVSRIAATCNEPGALKILAGDIAHLGERDERALSEVLRDIKNTSPDKLAGTGYDEGMLAGLVLTTRPKSEIDSANEAAAWVGVPDYEPVVEMERLIIAFANTADRDKFVAMNRLVILKRVEHAWSTRWPIAELNKVTELKFDIPQEASRD